MYRNIKYAFKIDIGTVETLLPLAICLSTFPKDEMNTIQRIVKQRTPRHCSLNLLLR